MDEKVAALLTRHRACTNANASSLASQKQVKQELEAQGWPLLRVVKEAKLAVADKEAEQIREKSLRNSCL